MNFSRTTNTQTNNNPIFAYLNFASGFLRVSRRLGLSIEIQCMVSMWFNKSHIRAIPQIYPDTRRLQSSHSNSSYIPERDYGFQCVVASTFLQSLSSINSFICLYNFFSLHLISSVEPKITNKLLYINKNWSKHTVFLASK